jgi:hypothetical protein
MTFNRIVFWYVMFIVHGGLINPANMSGMIYVIQEAGLK